MALKTGLYDQHIAAGARMMEFGGWDMPLQYEGILAEHMQVRNAFGIFDTSHMNAFLVEGSDSLDALSRIVTQNLRTLAVGACRYGFLLNQTAGVIDDLIVYRMGETTWMPVVNAGTAPADLAWIKAQLADSSSSVRDLRDSQAKIDVQGPAAAEALSSILGIQTDGLRRFRWMQTAIAGASGIVSRTGYTGEDGFELYAPHAAIASAWRQLLAAGATPCGLGARDTLRLEAGFTLYGHELDTETSPAEANLMRYAGKDEDFIGRPALLKRAASPAHLLVPFKIAGRQAARHGQNVCLADQSIVGRVTSGAFGPSVGQAIGFAYVRPDLTAPGTEILIDIGRKMLTAAVTSLPFLPERKSS